MFITVPKTETGISGYFGLTEADFPKLYTADMTGQMKKYSLDTPTLDYDALLSHVSNFLTGKLKPTLKSEEPVPEDYTSNVKIVKGKSFKEIVIDSPENVLFEIYAPWLVILVI